MKIKLPPADQQKIVDEIRAAEKKTSCELRVHLEHYCWRVTLRRAKTVFRRLGMMKTAQRNAVLIYVAVKSRKMAVYGDHGIHARLAPAVWQEIVEEMRAHFQDDDTVGALCSGVRLLGERLAAVFPASADDVNELSDDVTTNGQ